MAILRPAIAMIRVSGKAQIDRTGIPRQIELNAIISEENGLSIPPGNEYRFPGLSGAQVEKDPKFREMMFERMAEPEVAGIVASDISRLFRPEFADDLAITKILRENHKLIFYEDGVLDLNNQRDIGIFIDEARKAGAHRLRIKKNTSWGRAQRRKQGDCITDPVPRGVKFVPHVKQNPSDLVTGHFEYTRDENGQLDFYSARIIEAFRRIANGDSQAAVARDLKFSSPTNLRKYLRSWWWIGYKYSYNKRKGAGLREDGTHYDGRREFNPDAQPVKANFTEPPLIDREIFDRVQSILKDRKKTWVKAKQRSGGDLDLFLGHGILTCGICGMKLYPKPVKRRHTKTLYYICSSRANDHTPCRLPMLSQQKVDQDIRVWALLLSKPDYWKGLVPAHATVDIDPILKQRARLEKKKDALYDKIGDPDFDQKLLAAKIKGVESELREVEKELNATPVPPQVDFSNRHKLFKEFRKLPMAKQRELLRANFEELPIGADGTIASQPRPRL